MNKKHTMSLLLKRAGQFACIVLCALVMFSCATESAKKSSFYEENKKDFVMRALDNGIPVIIKKNSSNRICNIQILVSGGAAAVPVEKAGLESVVFALLPRGSQSASRADIQEILYRTSSAMSGGSGSDFSLFSLNCLDYHFDELFPLFIDSFLHPAFAQSEFTNTMNEAKQGIEATASDPFSLMIQTGKETVYQKHPYESMPSPTQKSVSNITLSDVKAHHKEILNARRVSVIAVGNYNEDDLIEKLNKTLGALPSADFTPPVIPPLAPGGPAVTATSDASKDIAYTGGFFAAPPQDSEDYIPYAIANSMLNDILFNIVREKYGAVYSIGTTGFSGFAPAGGVYAFKVMDMENLKTYLDEALNILAGGKIIKGKNAEGEYEYAAIEEKLPGYKNKYINSVFSSVQTNSGVASHIINGLVYSGDPEAYLSYTDKINAVTAEDILNTFNKYYMDRPKQWIIVSDKAGLSRFNLSEYDTSKK